MAIYDSFKAFGSRLVAKYGQDVTWSKIRDGTPSDSNKPWVPGDSEVTNYSVKMVFVPDSYDNSRGAYEYFPKSDLPVGVVIGIMVDVPFVPSLKDTVSRGGHILRIEDIKEVRPNSESATLWKIRMRE